MHDFLHVILPGRVVYRFSGVRGNLPVLTVTRTGNLPVPVPVPVPVHTYGPASFNK